MWGLLFWSYPATCRSSGGRGQVAEHRVVMMSSKQPEGKRWVMTTRLVAQSVGLMMLRSVCDSVGPRGGRRGSGRMARASLSWGCGTLNSTS